jgi:hypothetical protein
MEEGFFYAIDGDAGEVLLGGVRELDLNVRVDGLDIDEVGGFGGASEWTGEKSQRDGDEGEEASGGISRAYSRHVSVKNAGFCSFISQIHKWAGVKDLKARVWSKKVSGISEMRRYAASSQPGRASVLDMRRSISRMSTRMTPMITWGCENQLPNIEKLTAIAENF